MVGVALWPSLPPNGPVLMAVVSPAPGATIGLEGIELLVQFPGGCGRRRDLSRAAERRRRHGSAHDGRERLLRPALGLLPGDNLLRLEVFGRVPWSEGRLFEQTREVRVRMRPPQNLDQG